MTYPLWPSPKYVEGWVTLVALVSLTTGMSLFVNTGWPRSEALVGAITLP